MARMTAAGSPAQVILLQAWLYTGLLNLSYWCFRASRDLDGIAFKGACCMTVLGKLGLA